MRTDSNGERYVEATSIDSLMSGDELGALGMNNTGFARGVTGLLVRTWGDVTYAAYDGSYIYVDDGSGLDDGSGEIGVRVLLDGLNTPIADVPDVNDYVGVTGPAGKTLRV